MPLTKDTTYDFRGEIIHGTIRKGKLIGLDIWNGSRWVDVDFTGSLMSLVRELNELEIARHERV